MKKMLILLGVLFISLILVACGETTIVSTTPIFTDLIVEESDPSVEGVLTTFYKGKNDLVLLEIHLSNPDNLPITNININGYNYKTSRFTEDSTNSLIYFYIPAGTTLGEKTYSIYFIEYLDGDVSKSITISDNNEFKVYVYKNSPTVTRESYAVDQDSISIDFLTEDTDSVIIPSTLIAQLYSGETLVRSIYMGNGQANVLFDNLLSNKNYSVKVIASYNLDDSLGLRGDVVLYTGSFLTLDNSIPSAKITNPIVTSNSIVFDVTYTDLDGVTIPGGVSIGVFAGDVLVDTINIAGTTTVEINDLLNDNEYTLKVLSDYDLDDGHATYLDIVLTTYTFLTLPRSVPEPVLSSFNIEENRVSFEISIDDPDGLIDQTTLVAKIYVDGLLREEALVKDYFVDFGVYDLFSNYDFLIEIEASYDLNDGLGVQTDKVIFSEVYTTLLNNAPAVIVDDIIISQGYVTVNLDVIDINETLQGSLEAILYENDIEVDSIQFGIDTTELVFQYQVVFGEVYRIEIIGDYNLRDGIGLIYNDNLYTKVLTFLERKAPAAELNSIIFGKESISLNINIMDSDSTFVTDSVYVNLYLDGELIDSQLLVLGNNPILFEGLLSDNDYEVIVVGDYDLVDGTGILANQELISHTVHTEPKVIATAEITDYFSDTESITFDAKITDADATIIPGSLRAELYLLDEYTGLSMPLTIGNNFGIVFTGILSNKNYEVRVVGDYNLNDGAGVVSDFEMTNAFVRSLIKTKPSAAILSIESTTETISFDVEIVDVYGVIVDNAVARLYLYSDGSYTGLEADLAIGLNTNVTFSSILSDERYIVKIFASYDLNDGSEVRIDEEFDYSIIKTESKLMVAAVIYEVSNLTDSITFSVGIIDDDLIASNYKAVLYSDETYVSELPLIVGDNINESFVGLLTGHSYAIKIEADFDLNEGEGVVSGYVLDIYYVNTLYLYAPAATFANISQDASSITMDILVSDQNATSTDIIKAVLYKDGISTLNEITLNIGINANVTFLGLLGNNEYEVRVMTSYDLLDGNGEIIDEVLAFRFIQTDALTIPISTLGYIDISRSTVKFDFSYEDIYNVLVSDTVKVSMWVGETMINEKLVTGTEISFDIETLLADFDFVIKITGDYDLLDGAGVINDGVIREIQLTTVANAEPTIDLASTKVTQDSIDLVVDVLDADSVITGNLRAVLYDESDTELETINLYPGNNLIQFSLIVSVDMIYEVRIVSDYDLRDGELVQANQLLATNIIISHNKLAPEARVTNLVVDEDSIAFDVNVLDNYLTIATPSNLFAVLYKDNVPTGQSFALIVGANNGLVFTNLLSGYSYEIKFIVDYDNDNGNGLVEEYVMTLLENTTISKVIPTVVITNTVTTTTTLTFDAFITDNNDAGENYRAVLYLEGIPTGAENVLDVGANVGETFTSLLSLGDYEVRIISDYDLNDGFNSETDYLIGSTLGTTDGKIIPSADLSNVVAENTTITFDALVVDDDLTIIGNARAVLYKAGVATGDEISLNVGSNLAEQFTDLEFGVEYLVKLELDYNLNSGDPNMEDIVLDFEIVSTFAVIIIDAINQEKERISFNLSISDQFAILDDLATIQVVLYDENNQPVGAGISVYKGKINLVSFNGLWSNYNYYIRVIATYDVGDGDLTESVFGYDFTTEAMFIPNASIINLDISNATDIVFDISETLDSDGIIAVGTLEVVLFVNGVEATSQIVSGDGTYTFLGYDGTDGNSYSIITRATVDLNDANGPQVLYELYNYTFVVATKTLN